MLLDLLTRQLGGDTLSQVSGQLGISENQAGAAISAALPMLIGALARNASSPQGARSLDQAVENDHDGSILENLTGFLSHAQQGPGAGILRHVLGGQRPVVENAVQQTAGLDGATAGRLLEMLAPIVMGGLGKVKQQSDLGAGGLAEMLQHEKTRVREASPAGGLLSLLDADGDGSVVDDVAGMLGKFFR